MKVNFILPHFGVKPTGGFKIVYQYANYLSERGYYVNIIHTSSASEEKNKYSRYVKSYVRLKLEKNKWFEFNRDIKLLFVPDLSERYIPDADVTIATAWQTAKYLNRYTSSKGKRVYLIQGYEIWNGDKKEVEETWKYDMKKIVISKWLLDISNELRASQVVHIPNGLDHNKFKVIDDIDNRGFIISMMYSDIESKGAKDGLTALNNLKEEYPELKVKLFGKCKAPYNLPEWIEYYKNPEQKFLVENIYNKSSIFLSTSWSEGWGLPPMEAMACGCAVVSTDSGGVRDFIIDNKTALMCEPKNITQIYECMLKLVKDDDFRIELAKSGNKYIKKFNWDRSFSKFEEIITEA